MSESPIKSKVIDHFTIILDSEDGLSPKEWRLCYDYRAIAKIEEATGLSLTNAANWKDITSGKNFPRVIWGGLNRHNREVTQDDVLDNLNVGTQQLLEPVIFKLLFPTLVEAWEKQQAEKDTGATADPNQQAATPSA